MIPELAIDCARETESITSFIAGFVGRAGAEGVCFGMSGGIDSAVVAALCARAVTPKKVFALCLPERDSSPESEEDARSVAKALGISLETRMLTKALEELGCYRSGASALVRLPGFAKSAVKLFPGKVRAGFLASLRGGGGKEYQEFVAYIRMKHRLRLVCFYREAERRNLVVASCANRTEHETGFFVRYGDDSGEIAPIRHLYKMQVRQMGRHLDLPERILSKRPTPDLFGGIGDEEIFGTAYETLDGILCLMSRGLAEEEIGGRVGADAELLGYVKRIRELSRRLREPPASVR